MQTISIAIGSDHAGYTAKTALIQHLKLHGYQITDVGTHSLESADYPDFAHAVANQINNGDAQMGFLLCGSANGVAIAANKHTNIRAAIAWLPELAALARQHNNANILCFPARYITITDIYAMADIFLNTEFEGGRHKNRVDKINC